MVVDTAPVAGVIYLPYSLWTFSRSISGVPSTVVDKSTGTTCDAVDSTPLVDDEAERSGAAVAGAFRFGDTITRASTRTHSHDNQATASTVAHGSAYTTSQ